MNNDDNLDLLDLDDTASDTLPEAAPFAAPRPKKPWLLLGVGLLVIILATYIIIRTIGGDSSSSIDVDLDAPAVVVDGAPAPVVDVNVPSDTIVVPPVAAEPAPTPAPVAQPQPQPVAPVAEPATVTPGVPVRVVQDRKEVTFNPDKPVAQPKPAAKPQPKPAAKPQAKPAAKKTAPAKKPAPKPQVAPKGSWYVQFGSYSTRALAESAERQIRAAHGGLFAGKQFVILAAQLPNGTTTYRLRIAFKTSADANGFCQNAKSDGLDCYVAK